MKKTLISSKCKLCDFQINTLYDKICDKCIQDDYGKILVKLDLY